MGLCPNVNLEIYREYNIVSCLATGCGGGGYTQTYCLNDSCCGYCPNMGGDNRLLNPDCLTESVCAAIRSEVSRSADYTAQLVSESLRELSGLISRTGYMPLYEAVSVPAAGYITTPSMNGGICSVVQTEPEAVRASALESDIDSALGYVQPRQYYTPPIMDGIPRLGENDFSRIAQELNSFAVRCSGAAHIASGCGIYLYDSAVNSALNALGYEISAYFRRIADAVYSAERIFTAGSASVFSQIGNSTGFNGGVPGFFD